MVSILLAIILRGEAQSAGGRCTPTHLSQEQQRLLDKYLILEATDGLLVLSPRLGYTCEIREGVSKWLRYEIGGGPRSEDQQFAANHQEVISRVVLRVWPAKAASPAVPADGAMSHEKWSVLHDPMVDVSTGKKLVSEEVLKRGLWGDAAKLMFSRPLTGMLTVIQPILRDAHSDIVEKLYAIALLTREKSHGPIPSIDSITQGVDLTAARKRTADRLKKRILTEQPAEWSDVDRLVEDEI